MKKLISMVCTFLLISQLTTVSFAGDYYQDLFAQAQNNYQNAMYYEAKATAAEVSTYAQEPLKTEAANFLVEVDKAIADYEAAYYWNILRSAQTNENAKMFYEAREKAVTVFNGASGELKTMAFEMVQRLNKSIADYEALFMVEKVIYVTGNPTLLLATPEYPGAKTICQIPYGEAVGYIPAGSNEALARVEKNGMYGYIRTWDLSNTKPVPLSQVYAVDTEYKAKQYAQKYAYNEYGSYSYNIVITGPYYFEQYWYYEATIKAPVPNAKSVSVGACKVYCNGYCEKIW